MNEFISAIKAEFCEPKSFLDIVWRCVCIAVGALICFTMCETGIIPRVSTPGLPYIGIPRDPFEIGDPMNGTPGSPQTVGQPGEPMNGRPGLPSGHL